MLNVTLADLAYRYRQFLIAVIGAAVVLAMALLMAGLAAGFSVEINRTVSAVGADRWVMSTSSAGRLTGVGLFPEADVSAIAKAPGVIRAYPLVVLPQQTVHIGRASETVFVLGVSIGGAGDPHPSSGSTISSHGQIVVDSGVHAPTGSALLLDGRMFRVVGRVSGRTLLGGFSVVYVPLTDAQQLVLNSRPVVTAVVTQGVPTAVPPGLQVLTNGAVEHDTLGLLSGGISSIKSSKVLMWIIATIIVAALLYVSALQRARDFAVLKALGSSSLALFVSLAVQAVLVTLAAAGLAVVASNFMKGIFKQPVAIPGSAFATLPLVAIVVGLLSSLIALRQATNADPATAFGG